VFLFFGLSTVFATFVLGGIPALAQRLTAHVNIYSMPLFEWLPGWLYKGRTLWFFTFMEHALFLSGLIVFMKPFLPRLGG
jgi:hypothetical protein